MFLILHRHYKNSGILNCLRGKSIPSNVSEGFLLTLQDRIRIPWYGGARKIPPDVISPAVFVPVVLVISTMGIWWTVTTFTLTFISLLYISTFASIRKSYFFLTWTIASLVSLISIFEFLVVPYLEILIHENIILVLILSACVICVRILRAKTARLQFVENEIGDREKVLNHCSFCHVVVPEKDYHCLWIDTCIGRHNRRLSFLAIILAILFLLYNANLTLTTVCHPFLMYNVILLPDDCSEVYEQFEYSLCFVGGVYSMCIGILLILSLTYRVLLFSFTAFRLDKLSSIVSMVCHHWINPYCRRTIK
ncbi:hypothetical protein FQR65_LT08098 [Abscondita terminalis]|nr:hypothetical protein FQR65_LT08098 [Abscondita terminalis]